MRCHVINTCKEGSGDTVNYAKASLSLCWSHKQRIQKLHVLVHIMNILSTEQSLYNAIFGVQWTRVCVIKGKFYKGIIG